MAGYAVLQLEKAAQKWLFRLGKQRHVYRSLTSTQHRAQSNHQKFVKVVQTGIAAPRVFKPFPTGRKLLQGFFTGHGLNPPAKIAPRPLMQEVSSMVP